MLQSTDAFPMNIGLSGKGNTSTPEGMHEVLLLRGCSEGMRDVLLLPAAGSEMPRVAGSTTYDCSLSYMCVHMHMHMCVHMHMHMCMHNM